MKSYLSQEIEFLREVSNYLYLKLSIVKDYKVAVIQKELIEISLNKELSNLKIEVCQEMNKR